jgi:endoglucanase
VEDGTTHFLHPGLWWSEAKLKEVPLLPALLLLAQLYNSDVLEKSTGSAGRGKGEAMERRDFLHRAIVGTAELIVGGTDVATAAAPGRKQNVDATKLPRWRGFNLLEKFTLAGNAPYRETDFDWIRDWGFDFVRLPMDYRCWTPTDDPYHMEEKKLKEIDTALQYGRDRGIHVCLNFHRAPGYCVNPPKEPLDLWTDTEALKRCEFHWAALARRYKGAPAANLSFDLLNEPGDLPAATYARVVEALVAAIRAEDPERLIIADGIKWGNTPVPELSPLKIAQSTRGYTPMQVSHFRASWIHGSDTWPTPTWPLTGSDPWDKQRLRREKIEPWKQLERMGVGVHVGEWGAYQFTPHDVVLAWMKDNLDLWKEAGWGWAMWNFRGSFGVLDSVRSDVQYESFHGHKLDRQMLELIRA